MFISCTPFSSKQLALLNSNIMVNISIWCFLPQKMLNKGCVLWTCIFLNTFEWPFLIQHLQPYKIKPPFFLFYLFYNIVLVLPHTGKCLLISWEVYPSVGVSQYTKYKGSEHSCTEDVYFFNPGFNKLIWAQDTLSVKTSYRISLKRYQL